MDDENKIIFTFIAAVAIVAGGLIYKQVTDWGPAELARQAEAARQAQIIAEAKAVPVANKAAPKAEAAAKRFTAEFHGTFNAGWGNHQRDVLIVKDNQTGVEYLAITGCGTTELKTEQYQVKKGKAMVTETRTVEE